MKVLIFSCLLFPPLIGQTQKATAASNAAMISAMESKRTMALLARERERESRGETHYQMGMRALERGDEQGAETHFLSAVDSISPNAHFELGKLYHRTGKLQKSYEHFETAGLGSHVEALFVLAKKLRAGEFQAIGKNDQELAKQWMKSLANDGYGEAKFELGMMYYEGINGKKNLKKAWGWLHAAMGNHPPIEAPHYAQAEKILQTLPDPGCGVQILGCF